MNLFTGMNFIKGGFCPSRADFPSLNPANEQHLGYFPNATQEECDLALQSAKVAFPTWRKLSRIQRADYFDRLCQIIKARTDDLANAISLETGKNLNESRAEVIEALHMAQFCFGKGREACGDVISSELPERDSYIIRKPKGVVLVIAPWNFPFAIGGFWTSGPALLEGNTVVLKPSEETPMTGQLIAELYQEAGFPSGVFNLVHGDGQVGAYLSRGNVDHICFTGSAEVGQFIRRTCADSWHKTCSCEMGSKSALMIFPDADLKVSVNAAIASAFKLSGQRCVSAGRLLVHQDIYEIFSEQFVEMASGLKVGDPFKEPDSFFGPLINQTQLERVLNYNEMTVQDTHTKILLHGKRLNRKGYFLTPHVYQTPWADKYFLKQEVFGPHVALIPFKNTDEAIDIYNDTEYGLSLGAMTNDFRIMREIRQRCNFGLGYINLPCIGAESHTVFGGVGKSGNGSPSAAGTFKSVVHEVAWSVNHQQDGFQMPQGLK